MLHIYTIYAQSCIYILAVYTYIIYMHMHVYIPYRYTLYLYIYTYVLYISIGMYLYRQKYLLLLCAVVSLCVQIHSFMLYEKVINLTTHKEITN